MRIITGIYNSTRGLQPLSSLNTDLDKLAPCILAQQPIYMHMGWLHN